MKTNFIRQTLFPILAAFIWGTAFIAQRMSAGYLQPFTFNAARAAIAFFALLLASFLFRRARKEPTEQSPQKNPHYRRDLLLGGLSSGVMLTLATNLQQKGIETTATGKAGFLTALYIVVVPVLGIFLKKRASWTVWAGVALAVVGLYCLCIQSGFSIEKGDLYILLCSLCLSVQILLVDHFVQKVDGVELSCAQFFVVAALSAVGMFAAESPSWQALKLCLWPLLYVGVLSSGVAYTLQILAQKDSNPTVVSLLLSLESVFATLAGAVVYHDHMTGRESLGCTLMLCAVVLAQLPARKSGRQAAAELRE
jgi:drug/metabolite transporter (DMT)-like permease